MEVSKTSIRPGDEFEISLKVECSGAEAYDVLVSASFGTMGYISPLSPTTISLGDLGAGETSDVTYSLLASGDISAGQYPLIATITYTDSKGIAKNFLETLTIMIDGLIKFELLDNPPISVKPGETSEIEADLLLVGTESIKFVSIEMEENTVFKQVDGSEEYIGAVDPDSPIPFDIDFKISENAEPGKYYMNLNLQYRDHLNKEHEEEMSLDVSVIAGSNAEVQDKGINGLIFWLRRLFGLGP
jgi:hypothetical protein